MAQRPPAAPVRTENQSLPRHRGGESPFRTVECSNGYLRTPHFDGLASAPHRISLRHSARRLSLKGGNRRACIDLLGGKVAGIGWPPHRISLRLTARLLRLPLKGGVIPAVLTGDIVYTLDRVHGLHLARGIGQGAWFAAQESLPPLRGSRQDKGGARSRAGGGQTPRSVSECQRHG